MAAVGEDDSAEDSDEFDDDLDEDAGNDVAMQQNKDRDEDDSSSGDDSDSDGEDDHNRGVDSLQVKRGIDIPSGVHIPVISQLAKEAQKRDQLLNKRKDGATVDSEMNDEENEILNSI